MWRRNCLLRHVTGGKIEGNVKVTGRRGRRGKQLLDDLNDTIGYCKLKEEAVDNALCRIRLGRGCRPVARRTAKCMIDLAINVSAEAFI
jgi:hypothetical protein